MWWPFKSSAEVPISTKARVSEVNGVAHIDVRGQSCPNYLISIDRAFASLPPGIEVKLFLTYGPGDQDVRMWCKTKKINILSMEEEKGTWTFLLKKTAAN